ncbi:hypothetical protein [Amycolatopsis sp. lyj-84]|uniref:hypothetical protein n=1 Tax=Amycolatopsis sp. lyj-84 TaxID=2789284 RepID=UPI00397E429D
MNPGDTLFSSSRHFQLWSYGAGHSELILRSRFPPDETPVELYFEAVRSVHFDRLDFPELTVYRAEDEVLQSERYRFPYLRIELRSPDHTGVVVASSLTYIDGTRVKGTRAWSVVAPLGGPKWPT